MLDTVPGALTLRFLRNVRKLNISSVTLRRQAL